MHLISNLFLEITITLMWLVYSMLLGNEAEGYVGHVVHLNVVTTGPVLLVLEVCVQTQRR